MRNLLQEELIHVSGAISQPWEVSSTTCMQGFNSSHGIYDYFMTGYLYYGLVAGIGLSITVMTLGQPAVGLIALQTAKEMTSIAMLGCPIVGLLLGCRTADYCTYGN